MLIIQNKQRQTSFKEPVSLFYVKGYQLLRQGQNEDYFGNKLLSTPLYLKLTYILRTRTVITYHQAFIKMTDVIKMEFK